MLQMGSAVTVPQKCWFVQCSPAFREIKNKQNLACHKIPDQHTCNPW